MLSCYVCSMKKPRVLFIGGSNNQTTQMHSIARALGNDVESWFTPFFATGLLGYAAKRNLVEFTILGSTFRKRALEYFEQNNLLVDEDATQNSYDLVVTCSDLVVPSTIRNTPIVLVQEGMTDPENAMYHIVKALKLPRYLASTSTTGLSHMYSAFCVASEGYKKHFANKGVDAAKIRVTGIPNFDNFNSFLENAFPIHGHVLVATSDARETFKYDNRRKFLRQVREIVGDRQVVVKLHPNEKFERAEEEIRQEIPSALVYRTGDINAMIANSSEIITQYSSVVYVGIALGKPFHSYFNRNELLDMSPIQNDGTSCYLIADVCREVLGIEQRLHANTTLESNRLMRKASHLTQTVKV